jgi:hypothetical protein
LWRGYKKNQKQKTEKEKHYRLFFLCLYLCFMMCLFKIIQEVSPLKPPAASNFSMGKNIGQDMVHHEPWGQAGLYVRFRQSIEAAGYIFMNTLIIRHLNA